jgi:predicted PurR-regulated permease PerM
MNLSFQKIFFTIASIFAIFAILILAKAVLIPLGFALLISFILFPMAKKIEAWGLNRTMAASLSIISMLLFIAGGIYYFSSQIIELSKEFGDMKDKIILIFANITLYINSNVNFMPNIEKGELINRIKDLLNESAGSLVSQTFNNTASFLTGLLAAIVFTFLILIYRKGLVEAFIRFYTENDRVKVLKMFKKIQQVGKKYLLGMMLLIFILGSANSIGLWIIGIDNPFLFGFLAGVLAIVPYVGTLVGAAIPIIYTFMTYDSIWMPIAVAILFYVVQFIESNFLSPKIVGGSLKINALAAILSIIIGASVWGLAGMILFLPFTAMLKVFCEEYEELKPIGLIIGVQNIKKDDGGVKIISKVSKKIKSLVTK